MKNKNNTPSSEERWKVCKFIKHDGTTEVYENYMVSDHGRVKSLNYNHTKHEGLLVPHPADKMGHLQVGIRFNGKMYNRTVHRLVLTTFHPEQYFEGSEVDHIDRDVTNNNLCNLRFVDRNGNYTNRSKGTLKQIRVTHLTDGCTEEFDSMADCSRAFGKCLKWCIRIIRDREGFCRKYNIQIEKLG